MRLTPRGARDAIEGVGRAGDGSGHLAARVRAVPEKGRANTALERLVAAALDVPAGSVEVIAGSASRQKTLRVTGEPHALARRAESLWPTG